MIKIIIERRGKNGSAVSSRVVVIGYTDYANHDSGRDKKTN